MVTKEEYQQWCEWVRTESSLKPPAIIYQNYWQWNNRATMARLLMRSTLYEPALQIMETVVEHGPDEDDHYAWAIADLGCLYWRVHQDLDKAVSYLEQALEVLDKTEQNIEEMSYFDMGGQFLSYKLSILEQAGEVEKARDEAHRNIKYYQARYPDANTNSYVYHANLFLAELTAKSGDFLGAFAYTEKGLAVSEYANDVPLIVEAYSDHPEKLYNKLLQLNRSMVIAFDV